MNCKICGTVSKPLFKAKILNKYDVSYNRCSGCGFVQTDEPFWLEESYASAINEIDLGPVSRAVTFAPITEGIILSQFDPHGKFLDFGGGYGIFVRLMRDFGYDFSWFDAYCENIFAKHFPRESEVAYDLVTAFEVFEHLPDPLSELSTMLSMGRNIIFSTELVPQHVSRAQDWPYFGPDHGQHISFYTPAALRIMAERFGLCLVSDGFNFHMLSQKPMSERSFKLFVRNGYKAKLARKLLRRRHQVNSLLPIDFARVSGYPMP